MKEVEIISKVVGRTGTGAVGVPSVGGIPSVDLSGYLLKKVWDEAFELKETTDGTPYLYGKLPVVVQYGITMYGEGGDVNIPSIYAGLPIDGTTIYWDGEVLKAQGGGSGGGITDITSSMVVSALGYTPANASDLTALQSTVNDFLSGSDTDTIINKWKELETFLSGLTESDNLATILGGKANKATTLAGYGIEDAYTKSDVNTLLGDYVTLATAQTITGEKNFTGGLKVNGSPIVYDATNKYWKLEGDLLVTGGVMMYGNDSEFTPSTIMDAIVADNTNLKVIDGVLTFVGETGGSIEGLATVATTGLYSDLIGAPTLLSSFIDDVGYLKKSGGQMTGGIGYTLTPDSYQIGLPAAGTFTYAGSLITKGVLDGSRTFIGSVYNTSSGYFDNIISIRHRNGLDDGNAYGMYINTNTTIHSDSLKWNRQINGSWQGERVILDSHNWSQYVKALDGGNYLPTAGGILSGNLTISNPSVRELLRIVSTTTEGSYAVFSGSENSANVGLGASGALIDYIGVSGTGNLNLTDTRMVVRFNRVPVFELNNCSIALSPIENASIKSLRLLMDKNSDSAYLQAGNYAGTKLDGNLNITGINGEELTRTMIISSETILSHGKNADNWLKFMGNGAYSSTITFGISGSYQGNYLSIYNYVSGSLAARITGVDLLVYGGITMYSDIRKKTKLQDVELSLKQIADAPLIEHYYNSDDKRTTHVGSIAQYWAEMNDWFCKQDNEGYYTMEIQNAALASAISVARHLQKYESKTDKKIRMLKKRICELEDEVEKLKSK